MEHVKSVMELEVFKKAHLLTLELFKITRDYPKEEKFGLVSQIRRAASSIPANLMEGSYRLNTKEFRQFAGIANGSAGELKYHLLLSKDLGYISKEAYEYLLGLLDEVCKMLRGLIKSLS